MEVIYSKQQEEGKQETHRKQTLATPMHEIYANLRKKSRNRILDDCDDDYNDDDPDCYCE